MMYELIVIWDTHEKDVHVFTSEEAAKNAEKGMKKAFGKQIEFTCINKRSITFLTLDIIS